MNVEAKILTSLSSFDLRMGLYFIFFGYEKLVGKVLYHMISQSLISVPLIPLIFILIKLLTKVLIIERAIAACHNIPIIDPILT